MFVIGDQACVHHSKRIVNILYERHCSDKRYLARIAAGGFRYDEQGQETTAIAEQDQRIAAEKLRLLQLVSH